MPHLARPFNWRDNGDAHPRQPIMTLVYLALAFVIGILTGHVLRSEGVLSCATPGWLFPLGSAALAACLALLRRRPAARVAAAIIVFLALGAWRYDAHPFERCLAPADLAFWQSEEGVWATVEGVVVGYPQAGDGRTGYDLAVERVTIDGQARPARGRAWLDATSYPAYVYGDRLRARGLLLAPPVSDDFNYRRYLAARGIHSLMRRPTIEAVDASGGALFWRVLYAFRARASAALNRILPEPAASLTNGMVLGIEGGIPAAVNDAFRRAGMSHLVVISGSNIALLAGALVVALGAFLPRRRAALAVAPLILVYVLLVGADPPALRAGVMGLLGLGAVYFGRRGTAYVSLCAAGLAMLALNPLTLWDIGFQLSFFTSLGLILFTPPLSRALFAALRPRVPIDAARRLTRALEGTLIVTVAAQIAVLPLTLLYFGQFSLVSLLANLLVLPVQPIILAGGLAAVAGGLAWQPLGQILAAAPWLLLSYTAGVAQAAAALPFASVEVGRVGPVFVAGYYALLLAALAAPRIARSLRGHPALRPVTVWAAAVAVPVCLALSVWRGLPDERLHLVFIPGDDGEAALVVAPGGRAAWVWDGRGDGDALFEATQRGGWLRGRPDVALTACDRAPRVAGACVELARLAPAAAVALTDEVRLTRIAAGAEPALLLTYGEFRALLPATLPPQAQGDLPPLGPLSALKTAGPGTGAWPDIEFLRTAQPQVTLWPLETTYPPAVGAYLQTHTAAARIDPAAAVEIVSDGARFWLIRHSARPPR